MIVHVSDDRKKNVQIFVVRRKGTAAFAAPATFTGVGGRL
jgi:predicted Zn-dependent protease